ncbi:MAG TPA: glycogen debranching N-terminal domain-containing protein [Gaiellaceae bacterium]|nr:glycogen debranching N-terminal domain-containing protein [Gaiellaceae bacterium]
MALTVLEGSTFCMCDELGDLGAATTGFFADDTRFLSRFRVTINGEAPLLLSSGRTEPFSAVFYLRNPLARELPQDALLLVRTRFVTAALRDRLVLENGAAQPIEFELELALGCDFADIFTVKEHDFWLGHPLDPPPLPSLVPCRWAESGREAWLDDGEGSSTHIALSRPGMPEDGRITYRIVLQPHERWELLVDALPSTEEGRVAPRQDEQRFGDELARAVDAYAAWQLRVPQVRTSNEALGKSFQQSVSDIAALQMRSRESSGKLPAAGAPWFMAVFGRDTIITCLQTLLFGPELARAALDTLAALQAPDDDPSIDAEPGKIVHEVRHGKAARRWFPRYYGTVDATPLFLVLLSEVWRWTDDWELAHQLKEPALAALRWIDEFGDRDGDGFVEYARRTPHGLQNQSWKDSWDSQRFRDGRIAEPPIAPCEVQGYVYDAKRRMAELAREVWREPQFAERLEREADDLRRRFDAAFWLPERGCFALALDGGKERVDSATSNIGHLLWSGIVLPERVDHVLDCLFGDDLWSGWGVRTMSAADVAYNPLSYHNGTVWPHDNSLIAWGLARHRRWPELHRLSRAMFDAAPHFAWELPEVFSGIRRGESPFPVTYPTASRPQAWAAGTPVLLLQLLLGLEPDHVRERLVTAAPPELPHWIGNAQVTGVRAFDRPWDVVLEDGHVEVRTG